MSDKSQSSVETEDDGWMPMDTVPVDGSEIQAQLSNDWIVKMTIDRDAVARKQPYLWWRVSGNDLNIPYEPSHTPGSCDDALRAVCWRYLPKPSIRFQGTLGQRWAADFACEIAGIEMEDYRGSPGWRTKLGTIGKALYDLDPKLVDRLCGMKSMTYKERRAAGDAGLRDEIMAALRKIGVVNDPSPEMAASTGGIRP